MQSYSKELISTTLAILIASTSFAEPIPLSTVSERFAYQCDTVNSLPAIQKRTYNRQGLLSNRKYYQGRSAMKLHLVYQRQISKLKREIKSGRIDRKKRAAAKKKLKATKLLVGDIGACLGGDLSPNPDPLGAGPIVQVSGEATFTSQIQGSCTISGSSVDGDLMDPSRPPMLSLVGGDLNCALELPVSQNLVTFSLSAAAGTDSSEASIGVVEIGSFRSTSGTLVTPLCDPAPCDVADQARSALFRRGLKITVVSGSTRGSAVFK